jgi:predicted phosphoribosyltransferase
MATGLTMEAAARLLLSRGARQVVVAVPVASPESVTRLQPVADEVLVLDQPDHFGSAVGTHYRQFEQIDDAEVKTLLWEVNAGV